jgi:PKD domain
VKRPLLIAALSLGLLALPQQAAAAGWLADAPATAGASSGSVATDLAGDTFIVYKAHETELIDLLSRPAGGQFGSTQTIFSGGSVLTTSPSIAVDGAGDAVIAWAAISASPSLNYKVFAATRSAAGVVKQLGMLAETKDSTGFQTPAVAQNASGAAVIAWVEPESGTIEAVTRNSSSHAFGSLTTGLGASAAPIGDLAAAVDSSGNDVLAFAANGLTWVINATAGSWATSAEQVSNGVATVTGAPSLAAAGTKVLLAWTQGSTGEVFASHGTIAGGLSLPIDLSDATQNSTEATAAVDPAGDALVAWHVPPASGTISTIRASAAPEGSFPLPTQTAKIAEVSNLAGGSTASAMGASGQAILTWSHFEAGSEAQQGVSWTPTAGLTPVQQLSAPGEHNLAPMSDAADPLGDDIATWLTTSDAIRFAVYDAAPPTLAQPTIPTSTTAGQTVSMTVENPFDIWSAPLAASWSFGDGAGATGTSVAHAYTHSGTFTVSVAATDAAGNTTSHTGSITVSAAAASAAGSPTADASLTSSAAGTLTVSGPHLSPTRFQRGKRTATISKLAAKRTPTATMISFALSQPATVRLSFEEAEPGVITRHKCSAASKTHSKGRRCTRYVAVSHGVSRAAPAGKQSIVFDGVLDGGGRLSPGSYRLSLLASGAAGRATAAQHPTFTLLG